ncbi:MAG: hypothetical protein AAF310_01825 [Myxococcota bacterium]
MITVSKRPLICLLALGCSMLLCSCTKMRYAQTSLGQALTTPIKQNAQGIPVEIICNEGTVCAEVEVLSVNVEQSNAGAVQVLLHNRTGKSVLVQIGLWVLSPQGALLDETPFESVPLEPRQERMWQAQGVYQQNAKLQVRLRAATPRF